LVLVVRNIVAAIPVVLGLVSCSSPVLPTWNGQVLVSGRIIDYLTDASVPGARVTVGGATATTDASGFYSLSVLAGDQSVSVDGETLAIFVRMDGPTYRGDYYVRGAGCSGRYGMVIDKMTRRPVSGATVGGRTTTDGGGWFKLNFGCTPCLPGGTTFLSVTHPKYVDGSFVIGRGVCGLARVDYELEPR
jgi:hypothetical protein